MNRFHIWQMEIYTYSNRFTTTGKKNVFHIRKSVIASDIIDYLAIRHTRRWSSRSLGGGGGEKKKKKKKNIWPIFFPLKSVIYCEKNLQAYSIALYTILNPRPIPFISRNVQNNYHLSSPILIIPQSALQSHQKLQRSCMQPIRRQVSEFCGTRLRAPRETCLTSRRYYIEG